MHSALLAAGMNPASGFYSKFKLRILFRWLATFLAFVFVLEASAQRRRDPAAPVNPVSAVTLDPSVVSASYKAGDNRWAALGTVAESASMTLPSGASDYIESAWREEPFGAYSAATELGDRRDMFTKHFLNENGSVTAVMSAGPVHYMENGEWKTIYTRIEQTPSGFANLHNAFKTYYPAVGSGAMTTVLPDGRSLSTMQNMRMFFLNDGEELDVRNAMASPARATGSVISYAGVYGPMLDLRISQGSTRHKMDYRILSPEFFASASPDVDFLVFEETVTLPDGVIAKREGAEIMLFEGGKLLGAFTAPLVVDENPSIPENEDTEDQLTPVITAEYLIVQNGTQLTVQTRVPMSWLLDEARGYPLVVDPTLDIYPDNAMWWTQLGASNDTGFNDLLGVGRGNITGSFQNFRSSVKFNTQSIPTGVTINDVKVNYYITASLGWAGSNRRVQFRQATTDPVDWPTFDEIFALAGQGTIYFSTLQNEHSSSGIWKTYDLGTTADAYLQNTSLGLGWFALGLNYLGSGYTGNNNRYVTFAGHSDANRPYLTVDYTGGCIEPTPAGTLTVNKSETVSNDVLTYTSSGGAGLIGYEISWDNFANVTFFATTEAVFNLYVFPNATETLSARAVYVDGGCPESTSNTVTTLINCSSQLSNGTSDGDFITNVSIESINNSSTSEFDTGDPTLILDAYQDFTALSANLCKGASFDLSVTGTETFGANQGFAAWIDWNGDGVFSVDENVLQSAPAATATASVTVPLTAVEANVRMRVLCAWDMTPDTDACFVADYGWGEIEEYTISITGCVYYSVDTGEADDAIWNRDPNSPTGQMAIFGPSSSFVVRNGQTVSVTSNLVCNDLTVEADNGAGVLNFDDDYTVSLYGDLIHTGGSIDAGDGRFTFNAGTPQTINVMGELHDVLVNNASGVSLATDLDLRGVLQIDQGNFTATPYRVRLISDANGTAAIGAIANGSAYIGEVNYERFIPSGNQFWVNLGNPIPGKTLTDWNSTLITTGFPGSDFPSNTFVNIRKYDESVAGLLNEGFTAPQSVNDPLDDTFGYLVFMTAGSQFVSLTGGIQQGSKTVPLTYTSTGVALNDGWELVTNIYPSEVDWEDVYAASTGIGPTYYIYNAEAGSYASYTAELGLGTANGHIPSGQSFWVQTIQSGAQLVWEETHKSDMGTSFERDINPNISYVSVGASNATASQAAYLVFEEASSHGFDQGRDAVHLASMSTTAPEIAWKASSGEELLVSRIPQQYQNIEVYLSLNIKTAGTYTITVDETQNLPEFTCMYFEDLETGDVYSLAAGEAIPLTFEAPFEGDRFVLHVQAPVQASSTAPSCFNTEDALIEVAIDNASAFQLTLTDETGTVVGSSSTQAAQGSIFTNLAAGSYTITANSDDEVCHAMVINVEVIAPEEPIIDVLTNPAYCNEEGAGGVEVLASGAGSFTIDVFDAANNAVTTQTIEAGMLDIANLSAGSYQIIVNNLCTSEAFEVSLTDENAVVAHAAFLDQIVFENNAAMIQAEAQCVNAESWIWFVNGEEVSEGGNLSYTIANEGTYIVELVAFNANCSSSFMFEVSTTALTYVQNAQAAEYKLGMTREALLLWLPNRELDLMIDVFDTSGRLILQDQLNAGPAERIDLPTGAFATGTYILKLSGDNFNRSWTIQAHS
jgi:hypothetical protein